MYVNYLDPLQGGVWGGFLVKVEGGVKKVEMG
jgi:hypothetical protein